jgi:hypothetical protein
MSRLSLIYFSCEKGVGVRIWLLMLATMGPSRSLSSRTLCQAGSFWNAVPPVPDRRLGDLVGQLSDAVTRSADWRQKTICVRDQATVFLSGNSKG